MKYAIAIISALIVSPIVLSAHAAHAQAPAWRCVDVPGESDCQEALINDIEDTTVATWPSSVTTAMPSIPYTCTKDPGSGHQVFDPGGAKPNLVSSVGWQVTWSGPMRSFLIGRHTAAADLALSATVSGSRVTTTTWTGNTMNYLFAESAGEVQSSSGPTGVIDLGGLSIVTPTGAFWSASLPIVLSLADGRWTCLVGPPGQTVRATGTNVVELNYPVSATTVQSVLAEAVRNQFRAAVRSAIGVP